MRVISCKKCGTKIDADLGECPICGAVYYVLSESDESNESNDKPEPDDDFEVIEDRLESDDGSDTRIWQTPVGPPTQAVPPPSADRLPSGDVTMRRDAPGPERRRTSSPEDENPKRSSGTNTAVRGIDRRYFLVGGLALLAVLVVIVSFMTGAFDFGKTNTGDDMPNVVGLSKETATAMLETLNVVVTFGTQGSDKPEGTVLAQSAQEGKRLKPGETVMLIISTGKITPQSPSPEIIELDTPRLIGSTFEGAKREAERLGFIVTRYGDEWSDAPADQVLRQDPLPGVKLREGSVIRLTVSKGPEPSPSPTGFIISVTAGKGGSVSPNGIVSVDSGGNKTFNITPDAGYELRELKIDGTNIDPSPSYTFINVTRDHTLYVVFALKPDPSPSPSPSPTLPPTPEPSPEPSPPPVPTPEPSPDSTPEMMPDPTPTITIELD